MSWSYDADGNHTSFTDTTGATTYTRDAAGRIKTVHNPRLGEEQFTRDASGGLTAVTAGDLVQEWACRNGYLAEHTRRVDSVSDAEARFQFEELCFADPGVKLDRLEEFYIRQHGGQQTRGIRMVCFRTSDTR